MEAILPQMMTPILGNPRRFSSSAFCESNHTRIKMKKFAFDGTSGLDGLGDGVTWSILLDSEGKYTDVICEMTFDWGIAVYF